MRGGGRDENDGRTAILPANLRGKLDAVHFRHNHIQ
jgi:hypothetical protein